MKFPYKIVDLTHTLHPSIPTWDGDYHFKATIKFDYQDCDEPVQFRTHSLAMSAGIGTHIDAPAHCIPGGLTVDQLLLENLITPCVVIDITDRVHERYSLSVADIEQFEKTHGTIQAGTLILVRTGWDQYWNEPEKYRNEYIFPSISQAAAQLLVNKAIVGIGIDTFSPDRPEDGFIVHKTLLSAGKYIVENVANIAALPATGSYIAILPLKGQGLTEATVRLIGLI